MFEYFAKRTALDVAFIIDYWWLYLILLLAAVAAGIVKMWIEKGEENE